MMAMTLAPALCPAIGAYLTEWFGWRAIFVLLGGLGAAALALSAASSPRRIRAGCRSTCRASPCRIGPWARSGVFLLFALSSACSSASWFVFIASAPYLLSAGLHEPPSTYGAMILVPMAAYMLGNGAAARLGRRVRSTALFVCRADDFARLGRADGGVVRGGAERLVVVRADGAELDRQRAQPARRDGRRAQRPSAHRRHRLRRHGFLQMAVSAIGTLALAFFPRDSAMATVAVVAAAQLVSLICGVSALRRPAGSLQVVAKPAGD